MGSESFGFRVFLVLVMGLFMACAARPKQIYTDDQLYNMAREKIEEKEYAKARQDIEELEKLYPDSPLVANARLAFADTYYDAGEYIDAVVQYQRMLNFHPRNKVAHQAQYRLSMSYFYQIPNYEREQTLTQMALESFYGLLDKYPESSLVPHAKEKIKTLRNQLAWHILDIGEFYYRTEAYDSAIKRFRQVLTEFPQATDKAEKSMMFLARSYLDQGSRQEAKAVYRLFLKKFPQSLYTEVVEDYLDR